MISGSKVGGLVSGQEPKNRQLVRVFLVYLVMRLFVYLEAAPAESGLADKTHCNKDICRSIP